MFSHYCEYSFHRTLRATSDFISPPAVPIETWNLVQEYTLTSRSLRKRARAKSRRISTPRRSPNTSDKSIAPIPARLNSCHIIPPRWTSAHMNLSLHSFDTRLILLYRPSHINLSSRGYWVPLTRIVSIVYSTLILCLISDPLSLSLSLSDSYPRYTPLVS